MRSQTSKSAASASCILVAGDVCLDVIEIPFPPKPSCHVDENWRLKGETRTFFQPGGAMLLAEFIRGSRKEKGATDDVVGPEPVKPAGIADGGAGPLSTRQFLRIAERLKRNEIVHSLLAVDRFPATGAPGEKGTRLRLVQGKGFSGPSEDPGEPKLEVRYDNERHARIVVLDDTGNLFRRKDDSNPWPAAIMQKAASQANPPLFVYKLYSPLPSGEPEGESENPENKLWTAIAENHPENRIVIVSVNDLRSAGAPISMGLSWERTALDVVWHLMHHEGFRALRACPRLIVRLGMDGAVLWQHKNKAAKEPDCAWLIYDPNGIEGSFGNRIPGTMTGCGSAFAAALVRYLDDAANGSDAEKESFQDLLHAPKTDDEPSLLLGAITSGLRACRSLLVEGFGSDEGSPEYPVEKIIDSSDESDFFARHPVSIINGADEPDRSYWRLLESVFQSRQPEFDIATRLIASNKKTGLSDQEKTASNALRCVPTASYGALRTYDRSEIENYRALHTLLGDYLGASSPTRPLSIGVFGPPGAGKSFGVTQVAASLKGQPGCREVEDRTFNLSLYRSADELAGAFHLIRDIALGGKVPLVFFDEFDTALAGEALGWLRWFLAPMQDGMFLDRGAPHPIGQAVFIFAGGTCVSFDEFSRHPGMSPEEFRAVKGPDFLSRLRATLDIPSLNFLTAAEPVSGPTGRVQPPDTFNPYGPVASFPCKEAILLRRASILAFNLAKKAPGLVQADKSLAICPEVLCALLRMPSFKHGNRSFEALLDMSHLSDATLFMPSLLPPAAQVALHANPGGLAQLVATEHPLPPKEREELAKAGHETYRKEKKKDPNHDAKDRSLKPWEELDEDLKESSRGQTDEMAVRLRSVQLWLHKRLAGTPANEEHLRRSRARINSRTEDLAKAEHDRWVAHKRKQGWAPGFDTAASSKVNDLKLHNCLFPWDMLSEEQKDLDRTPIRAIPELLDSVGYEIIETGSLFEEK